MAERKGKKQLKLKKIFLKLCIFRYIFEYRYIFWTPLLFEARIDV